MLLKTILIVGYINYCYGQVWPGPGPMDMLGNMGNTPFGPQLQQFPFDQQAPSPQYGPQNQNGPPNVQGQNNGAATMDSIMDFIRKKYAELFPTHGSSFPPDQNPFPLPDLSSITQKCPKNGFFYSFSPMHMEAVEEVKQIIRSGNTSEGILDVAKALRQSPDIHPHLWFYAFSTITWKEPGFQAIQKVSPVDALPDVFINMETLEAARRNQRSKRQALNCVTLDETVGADNGAENVLWYFRENVGVNAHHWYYHTMYPFRSNQRENRRGELFYYMHASLVARYNAERLSNGLPRVQPIAPIQQGTPVVGYNPHLQDDNSGLRWSARPHNTPLNDAMHQRDPNIGTNIFINSQILQAMSRIQQSISQGFVFNTQNQRISLNNLQGIDILGSIIQADIFSLNPNYYGSGSVSGVHNSAHLLLALLTDPQFRLRLPPGVMADAAPAMRDPLFYQWHTTITQLFDQHKATLPPYTATGGDLPLLFPGITITNLRIVQSSGGGGTPNLIRTFWGNQPITLNRGLDFTAIRNPIRICAKQLDHEPFSYQLSINRDNNAPASATVRIFLAPRFDESGNRFPIGVQRGLFFVLDTFGVNLNPGVNTIVRRDVDSTLTIPWSQSLSEMNNDANMNTPYCGCGWPTNMLIPKGTPNGMVFDLFVMITNGANDAVRQTAQTQTTCVSAPLYCGLPNGVYPDAKPMGYPFDRMIPQNINTLDNFVNGISNMATTQVVIQFTGQ